MFFFKKLTTQQWHNLREWVSMAAWITGAVLLAYGIAPYGKRWLKTHFGKSSAQVQTVKVVIFAVDQNTTELVTAFLHGNQKDALQVPVQAEVLTLPIKYNDAKKMIDDALSKVENQELAVLFNSVEGPEFVLEAQAFKPAGVSFEGPQRYLSRLPLQAIQRRLESSGFSASINYSSDDQPKENEFFYALIHSVDRFSAPSVKEFALIPTKAARKTVLAGMISIPQQPKGDSRTHEEWGRSVSEAIGIILESSASSISKGAN